MDAMNEVYICDGKFVFDSSDPSVGTTLIYEDYRGTNAGIMADYLPRDEQNALLSNTIFVFRFNTDGKLKTQSAILKKQEKIKGLQTEFFTSFYHFINNGKVTLIFNDNIKNIDNKSRKIADPFKTTTVIASVDENGTVSKIPGNEFNTEKMYFFSPKLTKKLDNNTFIICKSAASVNTMTSQYYPIVLKFGTLTIK
jgi:hypothetical protein